MITALRRLQHLGWMTVLGLLLVLALLMVGGTAQAVQVQGGTTRIHTVDRGQTVDGIIALRNDTASPEWVRLYLTDYLHDARTGWQYPSAGTLAHSCAAWIDLLQTEVLLQPGESRSIFYKVAVPENTEIQGTYWCALMVEPQTAQDVPIQAEAPEKSEIVLSIRHVIRYQVSLIVNVGSSGVRSLTFAEPTLGTNEDGGTYFQVLIENAGQRWLNPVSWLEVYDDAGQLVGRAEAPRSRILPGVAVKRVFDLTGLTAGEYQALLIVDDGEDAVFGTVFALHMISE